MAILKIARMGHPVLLQPAHPVADPAAPEIRALVDDMLETLGDAGGVGLAAPQVHMSSRVVIFFVPEDRTGDDPEDDPEDDPDDAAQPPTVMINPEIEPIGDDEVLGWEACLSVPDLMGAVPRFARIRYRWTNLDGETEERQADGFHARVVQHECDHLDGILFPMRMRDLSLLGYAVDVRRNRELLDRVRDEEEDGEDGEEE